MRRTYVYFPFDEEEFRKFFAELLHKELHALKLIQPEEKGDDEWLDVTAVAKYFSRSRSRIYKYTRSNILTGYRIPGIRGLRYKKSQIQQAFQELNPTNSNIKSKPSNF
jgi:hypothetical protein